MESDANKIFVGGISWETTEEKLKEYFSSYGPVVEAVIMKDRNTGRGRGFGFVVFAEPDVADRVVQDKHQISGKLVEAKKAVPKDEHQITGRTLAPPGGATINANVPPSNTNHPRTKKIFVGGLSPNVTEDDFRQYFEQFGNITDVVVMYDHATQRPRGFGFITFDAEEAVDNVLQKTFHELKDKMVEVKRAVPKDPMGPSRNPNSAFQGPRGPYPAYSQGYGPPYYGPRYPTYSSYGPGYGYGYAGYGYAAPGAGAGPGAYAYTGAPGSTAGSYGPGAGVAPRSSNYYGSNTPAYGANGGAAAPYNPPGTYNAAGGNWGATQPSTQGGAAYGGGGGTYGYAGGNDGSYPYGRNSQAGYGAPPPGGSNQYGTGNYVDGSGYYDPNGWRDPYTAPGAAPVAGGTSPATESGTNGVGPTGGGYGYGAPRQSQRGGDVFLE